MARLQNTGVYGIKSPKALTVVPSLRSGAAKGLRALHTYHSFLCFEGQVFKTIDMLLHLLALLLLQKHCENVAVISSNSNLIYLMPIGSQPYG